MPASVRATVRLGGWAEALYFLVLWSARPRVSLHKPQYGKRGIALPWRCAMTVEAPPGGCPELC